MYPLELEHVTKRYGYHVVVDDRPRPAPRRHGVRRSDRCRSRRRTRGRHPRNLGGAAAAAILVLFVLPPLVVQLFADAASSIPPALFAVISGITTEVSLWVALLAIAAWAGSRPPPDSWPSGAVTSYSGDGSASPNGSRPRTWEGLADAHHRSA